MVLRLTTLHWASNKRPHPWEWPVCSGSICGEDKWVIPSKIMYLLKTAPARITRLHQSGAVEQRALVKASSRSAHGTERRGGEGLRPVFSWLPWLLEWGWLKQSMVSVLYHLWQKSSPPLHPQIHSFGASFPSGSLSHLGGQSHVPDAESRRCDG